MSNAIPVHHTPAKLAGHVALVTGAGSGIGRASAVAFAREGAAVAINYLVDEDDAEETRRQVAEAGGTAVVVRADVGVEEEVERLFARAEQALGPVTILMNNAGADASGTRVADLSLDDWSKMIASNLTGPFLCARRFIRAARAQRVRPGVRPGVRSGVRQDYQRHLRTRRGPARRRRRLLRDKGRPAQPDALPRARARGRSDHREQPGAGHGAHAHEPGGDR